MLTYDRFVISASERIECFFLKGGGWNACTIDIPTKSSVLYHIRDNM